MRNTVNAAPSLKAWGVSESQAVARFVAAATPGQKHEFDVVADNGHKWDSVFVFAQDYYPGTDRKPKRNIKIWTCARCRYFAKCSTSGPCDGLDRPIHKNSLLKWEELKASPGVRKKLAAAWGCFCPCCYCLVPFGCGRLEKI